VKTVENQAITKINVQLLAIVVFLKVKIIKRRKRQEMDINKLIM